MSAHDRQQWDARYRQKEDEPYPDPNPLLFQYVPPALGETHALDLAAGLGQNALWLAAQGYVVDAMDISRVALQRAQAEAAARGLHNLNFFQADFDHTDLQPETYDLICVFRFLKRELFPQLRLAVRPGGRILYETFNIRHLDHNRDFNPDYLLQPGELAGYFRDWKILHSAEPAHISQLVAVKPG